MNGFNHKNDHRTCKKRQHSRIHERERERICMGLVWEWGYARKAQLAHSNLTSIDVTTNPDPKVVYMRAL